MRRDVPGAEERSNKLRAGMRIESRRADAGFGGTETMDRHLIIQIVQERSVTPVRGGKLQAWRFRRRELLRTYLHDIRRTRTIVETTDELSSLADAILEYGLKLCLQELDNRYGSPQRIDGLPLHGARDINARPSYAGTTRRPGPRRRRPG